MRSLSSPFIVALLEARRNQSLSRAALDELQKRKFRALLSHAAVHAPFYRELGRDCSAELSRIRELPVVTKDMMISRPSAFVSDPRIDQVQLRDFVASGRSRDRLFMNRYIVSTTSGTSGRRANFINHRASLETFKGVLMARNLRERLHLGRALAYPLTGRLRMAMLTPTDGPYISNQVTLFQPRIASLFAVSERLSIFLKPRELVEKLNRFQPHYLFGYPSLVEALARESLSGTLQIAPHTIALSSEPFTLTARTAIAKGFPDAQIAESYSTSECLAIASRCAHGRLHLNSDFALVEPIDGNGQPVAEGELSDAILVTNLVNRTQPIIRYRLDDRIRLCPASCECGSPFPVVELHGRSDDTLYLLDQLGRPHAFPPIPFEILCLQTRNLVGYQICHERQNVVRVSFIARLGANDDVRAELTRRLRTHFADGGVEDSVELMIEPVNDIARAPGSGKIRQIYSRVPRPNDAVLQHC